MAETHIEWTATNNPDGSITKGKSWNPVRGCSITSKGCLNCYAMKQAHRFSGHGKAYEGLTELSNRGPVWNGKIKLIPELLNQPLRWRKPSRIFVNSMSDLFHEDIPFEFIASVFSVMAVTTRHTYQILTKRPQRMQEFFNWVHEDNAIGSFDQDKRIYDYWPICTPWKGYDNCGPIYPYKNVWLGVSVEDQKTADERIPILLETPAAIRWISAEPLLSEIDIDKYLEFYVPDKPNKSATFGLDWVVVGGESGPKARPICLGWIKNLISQCKASEVPIFVKQLGANPINQDHEHCTHITHSKGADIKEWHPDLRVREFPILDGVIK